VVVSIRDIQYDGQIYTIPYHPSVLLLRDTITGLQRGRIEHEWCYKVPKWEGVEEEKEMEGQEVYA